MPAHSRSEERRRFARLVAGIHAANGSATLKTRMAAKSPAVTK
jgi:hypothetical protein